MFLQLKNPFLITFYYILFYLPKKFTKKIKNRGFMTDSSQLACDLDCPVIQRTGPTDKAGAYEVHSNNL